MTSNTAEAPVAKRPRKTATKKATTKTTPEATGTEETQRAKRSPRTRRTEHPVTVQKVALVVQDLAKSLYDSALERVGGDPKKLYRIKVLSPSRYEMDMTRPKPADVSD